MLEPDRLLETITNGFPQAQLQFSFLSWSPDHKKKKTKKATNETVISGEREEM